MHNFRDIFLLYFDASVHGELVVEVRGDCFRRRSFMMACMNDTTSTEHVYASPFRNPYMAVCTFSTFLCHVDGIRIAQRSAQDENSMDALLIGKMIVEKRRASSVTLTMVHMSPVTLSSLRQMSVGMMTPETPVDASKMQVMNAVISFPIVGATRVKMTTAGAMLTEETARFLVR